MANDGSRWVATEDISATDANALQRLWDALEAILKEPHHTDSFHYFGTGDGRHWYSGCSCSECVFKADRLEIAQAELELGFKSVAITSEIEDSGMTDAWKRVAAWFEAGQKKAVKQAIAAG